MLPEAPGFLIDANLPYRFNLWRDKSCLHVFDLDDAMPDIEIWRYARENNLVIVTKDADFSDWIMLAEPPPRVIHFRVGNMRMRDFHALAQRVWPQTTELVKSHKLVIVHERRIECVA